MGMDSTLPGNGDRASLCVGERVQIAATDTIYQWHEGTVEGIDGYGLAWIRFDSGEGLLFAQNELARGSERS